jgi:hypothetical protein
MSLENLGFTNFKLLFLRPIFHGLSPSTKMTKVEILLMPSIFNPAPHAGPLNLRSWFGSNERAQ